MPFHTIKATALSPSSMRAKHTETNQPLPHYPSTKRNNAQNHARYQVGNHSCNTAQPRHPSPAASATAGGPDLNTFHGWLLLWVQKCKNENRHTRSSGFLARCTTSVEKKGHPRLRHSHPQPTHCCRRASGGKTPLLVPKHARACVRWWHIIKNNRTQQHGTKTHLHASTARPTVAAKKKLNAPFVYQNKRSRRTKPPPIGARSAVPGVRTHTGRWTYRLSKRFKFIFFV